MAIVGPFPKRQSVPVSKCSADVIVYEYLFVCAVWRRRRHCTYVLHVSVHLDDIDINRNRRRMSRSVASCSPLLPFPPFSRVARSFGLVTAPTTSPRRMVFPYALSPVPHPAPAPRSQFRCTCM